MKRMKTVRSGKRLVPEEGEYRGFPALESALMLLLSAYALCYKLFEKPYSIWAVRLSFLAAGALFLYYYRRESRGTPAERTFLLFNVLWVCATCVIHGSLRVNWSLACLWAVLFYCAFAYASSRTPWGRELALDLCCALLGAALLAAAVLGIVITLTGTSPVQGLPVLDKLAFLDLEGTEGGEMVYLCFFNTHRNTSASFFVLGMGLMISRCVRHGGLLWTLAGAVSSVAFFAAIALQHSRNTYAAASVCLAVLLGVLAQEKLRLRRGRGKTAAVVLVVALSAAALFLSFNLFSRGLVALAQVPAQVEEDLDIHIDPTRAAAQTPEPVFLSAAEQPAQQPEQVVDNRDTLKDLRTLTGRTDIWRAVLKTIGKKPDIALWGCDQWTMRERFTKAGKLDPSTPHTHNTLLQQLLMTGIPGLLLYLGLLLTLLARLLLCYFSPASAHLRCMTAPLAGMLVYGVLEPLLSCQVKFPSLLFCLLAGFFVSEWRDWQSGHGRTPRRAKVRGQENEEAGA